MGPSVAHAKPGVAVLNLQGPESLSGLLPVLTEILTAELDALGRFRVVAGSDVRTMLGFEKDKDLVGCDDASCLAEIGGALGVDRIVAGQIGKVGATYVVNIKLINIRKAETEMRIYETVRGEEDALIAMIKRSVGKLFATATTQPDTKTAATAAPQPSASVTVETETGPPLQIGVASWGLWAAGAGSVAAGIVFGLGAKKDEACANDSNCNGGQLSAASSKRKAVFANIGYGVGALALGVGTALLFMGNDAEPTTSLAPVIDGNQVGIVLGGRF